MTSRAFFWSADAGGTGFYRMQLPAWILGEVGVDVHETSYSIASFTKNATIVGQRVCMKSPSETWQEFCRRKDTVTVYDLDDHYFAVDPLSSTAHQFFNQPSVQNRIIENAKAADFITTVSEPLAQVMREKCPSSRVVVIPNGLPISIREWQPTKISERIVLGFVGTSSTWFELKAIAPHVNKFLKRNPHAEFHTFAMTPDWLVQCGIDPSLQDQIVINKPIHPTMDYLRAIHFDVWLAPYRPTPYNQCKFPTKALEAMFLGIPIIASNIDPYRDAIRHGETGFVVKDADHEWTRYMHRLVEDDKLRATMRKNARVQASYYSMESRSALWLSMIKEGPR